MSKRYRLKKDWPDAKSGDIYQWNGQGYSNQTRTSMVISRLYVEVFPDWFEEIVEPERIEVKNLSIAPFNNPVDYSAHWYNFGATGQIQQDKFPAIKEAIEGVLNPKPEASHTPAPESKEWEIECFRHKGYDVTDFILQRDGKYVTTKYPEDSFTASDFIDNKAGKTYSIHAVRRLSDNEVFTVGDEVYVNADDFKIGGFDVSRGGCYVVRDNNPIAPLSSIKRTPKPQPLFVTEDGKDIFEGGEAFYVEDENNFKVVYHGNISQKRTRKYFATSESANEYSLMNKPCLSVQDVMDRLHSYFVPALVSPAFDNLKHFAKSKQS